jgi:hypothetical protein
MLCWLVGLVELILHFVFGREKSRNRQYVEEQETRLRELLDRAEADPAAMRELVANPLGIARAAGLDLGFLRYALHMRDASEASLGQMLVAQARSAKVRTPPTGD